MLLVPAADGVPLTLIAPRLEATPARTCAAAAAGAVEVVTWEETEDPMALVASRLSEGLGRDASDLRAVAVNDSLRAAFVLGLQRVLPRRLVHRRVDRPAPAPDAQGRRRGRAPATRGAGRGPGRARDRERQARRAHRGRRRARGPRAAARGGPRGVRVLDRRLGPEQRLAPPRRGRAGDPGPASRSSLDIGGQVEGYGSDITRTLWVTGGDADGRPRPRVPAPVRGAAARPGGRVRGRAPGRRVRGDRRRRARRHHRGGLRAQLLPPHRARHRPRGPRGAVPRRGQRGAAGGRATRSASSPASTSRAGTAPASRTSSCARTRAGSRSTRRRGTCSSSRADQAGRRGRVRAGRGIIRRSRLPTRPAPREPCMTFLFAEPRLRPTSR